MHFMESVPQWIVLAHILRPQGRKGEVLADLFTDFPERFQTQPRVWLAPVGFAESTPNSRSSDSLEQSAEVAAHWLPVGRNAGRVVLKFVGVDTIEQAEKLAGKEVIVPLAERIPLDADAAYISDLVGCTVFDRDVPIGSVKDVEFAMTPDGSRRLEDAAPLLTIASPDGQEVLVPFAKAYLLGLDTSAKTIRMALPEGLVDINHSQAQPSDGV
jgi:16S rRNA processing protein RimM